MLGDAQALASIRDALRRHLLKADLAKAATARSSFQEQLAGTTGNISQALRGFVDQELGQTSITSPLISSRYAGLMAELRRVRALAADLSAIDHGAQRVRQAGAVRWAARLTSTVAPVS